MIFLPVLSHFRGCRFQCGQKALSSRNRYFGATFGKSSKPNFFRNSISRSVTSNSLPEMAQICFMALIFYDFSVTVANFSSTFRKYFSSNFREKIAQPKNPTTKTPMATAKLFDTVRSGNCPKNFATCSNASSTTNAGIPIIFAKMTGPAPRIVAVNDNHIANGTSGPAIRFERSPLTGKFPKK